MRLVLVVALLTDLAYLLLWPKALQPVALQPVPATEEIWVPQSLSRPDEIAGYRDTKSMARSVSQIVGF